MDKKLCKINLSHAHLIKLRIKRSEEALYHNRLVRSLVNEQKDLNIVPVEEIGIGIFAAIARFVAWFAIEIFFQAICWGIGWVVLKTITFGKYPNKDSNQEIVCVMGLIVLVASAVIVAIYTN